MSTINRKLVEEYFNDEWVNLISGNGKNLLVELVCQSYHLNKPHIPDFVKNDNKPAPYKLGEV